MLIQLVWDKLADSSPYSLIFETEGIHNISIYIYIYIERERERERKREREKETDRQTVSQTGSQTDRQTDKELIGKLSIITYTYFPHI